jgi:hypothetical protein
VNFGNNAFAAAGFGFKPGAVVTEKWVLIARSSLAESELYPPAGLVCG